MQKIAKIDNQAMNHLFKLEASRRGIKLALEDPQAFKDHKDYLETVDSVLKSEKTNSWPPNEQLLD